MKQTQEKIAIIMRSFNDADVIQGTLEALSKQTLRQFELWNFDSTSTDGTLEIIRKFNHPDRIRLIESLGSGEKDVNTIADSLDLPTARVSQHLALLRAHRIVDERPDGRHRYYHLVQPEFALWIVNGLDFIEGRISNIDRAKIRAARRLWTPHTSS